MNKIIRLFSELFVSLEEAKKELVIKLKEVTLEDERIVVIDDVTNEVSVYNEAGELVKLEDGVYTLKDSTKLEVKDGMSVIVEEVKPLEQVSDDMLPLIKPKVSVDEVMVNELEVLKKVNEELQGKLDELQSKFDELVKSNLDLKTDKDKVETKLNSILKPTNISLSTELVKDEASKLLSFINKR
jgi:FtsZ-binding cell division protein ZapB